MQPKNLIPLHVETRLALPTSEAAQHLSLAPQTLRTWASRKSGRLQPVMFGRRLYWPVEDLKKILQRNGNVDAGAEI